jgi:hypothetical protein
MHNAADASDNHEFHLMLQEPLQKRFIVLNHVAH